MFEHAHVSDILLKTTIKQTYFITSFHHPVFRSLTVCQYAASDQKLYCGEVVIWAQVHVNVKNGCFFTSQMLDKIKYKHTSVQICTISGIHYWGRCTNLYFLLMVKVVQICTLGVECTNLYNFRYTLLRQAYKFVLSSHGQSCTNLYTWGWVYKFVHLGLSAQICTLGVECTNLCVTPSVQICALLGGREVHKFVL